MRIGILGAGQLGRMLALAGYPLGLCFSFVDTSPNPCASQLGHYYQIDSQSPDPSILSDFLKNCHQVTFETENTSLNLAKPINQQIPLRPGLQSLTISQDRLKEKAFVNQLNLSTAPYWRIDSIEDLKTAITNTNEQHSYVLKTSQGGYDGKGQSVISAKNLNDLESIWQSLQPGPLILESFIEFTRELSIIAVRNSQGKILTYPLAENKHQDGILQQTIAPAAASKTLLEQAIHIVTTIADNLNHIGIITVELFDTADGLLVNEIAPRVHNSGHWTIEGARTSQFENHLRAICDLPLGATTAKGRYQMVNFLGSTPPLETLLADPKAHAHYYNKANRLKRKVGHVTYELPA